MLLHLCPRFYGPAQVVLIDLYIEPFDFVLRGRSDLATRRPYPNKQYQVGCRRKGNTAFNGLLIETPQPVVEFTTRARWAVGAECVVEHTVTHHFLDQEFDFASEDMTLWYACSIYSERRTATAKKFFPVLAQPLMELNADQERPYTFDVVTKDNILISRHQDFELPTLERGRLARADRAPRLEDTFVI